MPHQAAKEQCSSYRTFYVMIVYFPSLIADCLMLTGIQYGQKVTNHPQLWPCPGSLDLSKTVLLPGRECNPGHSGVPGSVRVPGQALGISKGLQHEVQGNPQQPKWTSKGMPSTLQWQTNGQQLAIRGRRQGRSPSDILIYRCSLLGIPYWGFPIGLLLNCLLRGHHIK